MTVVRTVQFILFVCIFCWSCNPFSKEKFVFYDRSISGINQIYTYTDYIKITNYSNRSITANTMYDFAKEYIDTVKADKIVRRIVFIGEKSFGFLPEGVFDDPDDQIKKLCLLDFSFADSLNFISSKRQNIKLYTATIWRKGDHDTYYCKSPREKIVIDSLLNSKQPFDNNF